MTIQNKINPPQITFSDAAIGYIKYLMEENKIPKDFGLRISAEGSIGSPIKYDLGFDPKRKQDDFIFIYDGITVLTDVISSHNLDGISIDFIKSETRTGFIFNNPNQTHSCGGCSCNK